MVSGLTSGTGCGSHTHRSTMHNSGFVACSQSLRSRTGNGLSTTEDSDQSTRCQRSLSVGLERSVWDKVHVDMYHIISSYSMTTYVVSTSGAHTRVSCLVALLLPWLCLAASEQKFVVQQLVSLGRQTQKPDLLRAPHPYTTSMLKHLQDLPHYQRS